MNLKRARKHRAEQVQLLREAGADVLAQLLENSEVSPAERDEILKSKTQRAREDLWMHWMRIGRWSLRETVHLLAGHDPKKSLLGAARHGKATRAALIRLTNQVRADIEAELRPLKGGNGRIARYRASDLLPLAAKHERGFGVEIEALRKRFESSIPGLLPAKRVRLSSGLQRQQLVADIAALLVPSYGTLESDGYHLRMNKEEFLARGRTLFPTDIARRLLAVGVKTLERARLERDPLSPNPIPRVWLAPGKPSSSGGQS